MDEKLVILLLPVFCVTLALFSAVFVNIKQKDAWETIKGSVVCRLQLCPMLQCLGFVAYFLNFILLQQAQSDVSHSTMPNSILTGPRLQQTLHHPELKSLLHASLGTCVAPPKHILHGQLSTQLNAIREAIPHSKPFPFVHFASAVHNVVNTCLHPQNVLLLPHKLVQKIFTLAPDSIPIRVDKYPLLFVVATTVTFLRIFILAFKGAIS